MANERSGLGETSPAVVAADEEQRRRRHCRWEHRSSGAGQPPRRHLASGTQAVAESFQTYCPEDDAERVLPRLFVRLVIARRRLRSRDPALAHLEEVERQLLDAPSDGPEQDPGM